ncbi:hypothetical protein V1509DRAFT_242970 [Lipomyces kononenkoae]
MVQVTVTVVLLFCSTATNIRCHIIVHEISFGRISLSPGSSRRNVGFACASFYTFESAARYKVCFVTNAIEYQHITFGCITSSDIRDKIFG